MQLLTDYDTENGWEMQDGVACWEGTNDSLYKILELDGGEGWQLEISDNQGYTIAYGNPTKRFADTMWQARRLSGYLPPNHPSRTAKEATTDKL